MTGSKRASLEKSLLNSRPASEEVVPPPRTATLNRPHTRTDMLSNSSNVLYEIPPAHSSRDVIATPPDDDDLIAIARNLTPAQDSRGNDTLLREKPRNGTVSRDDSMVSHENSITSRGLAPPAREPRVTSNSSSTDFRHTGTLESGDNSPNLCEDNEDIYENLLPLR